MSAASIRASAAFEHRRKGSICPVVVAGMRIDRLSAAVSALPATAETMRFCGIALPGAIDD
jgi:hypothetical protein